MSKILDTEDASSMRVILTCGSTGSRLYPLTRLACKSLIPIAGKPVLGHILDWCEPLDAELVVSHDVTDRQIPMYLDESYPAVKQVAQDGPNGNGEAVWYGLKGIEKTQTPVLIINGDSIPYGTGADLFVQGLGDTSCVSVWETDNTNDCGIVEVDRLGYVTQFYEQLKPDGLKSNLFLSGIYYVKRADYLYQALDTLIRNNVRIAGEFRLTGAFKLMHQYGEPWQIRYAQTLDCGYPFGVLEAERLVDGSQTPTV